MDARLLVANVVRQISALTAWDISIRCLHDVKEQKCIVQQHDSLSIIQECLFYFFS
jgi:hypothetical protein